MKITKETSVSAAQKSLITKKSDRIDCTGNNVRSCSKNAHKNLGRESLGTTCQVDERKEIAMQVT